MKKFKQIYIEITNICNLSCTFCAKSNREKKYLTIKEFEIIITKIKDYTESIYLHVKGEPLTHPYFKDIILLCDKYNITFNITTNATFLNKYKDILLNSTNLKFINISLQSYSFQNNKNIYINDIKDFISINETLENKKYIKLRFWHGNINDNLSILNEINRNVEFIDKNYITKNCQISIDKEFIWPDLNNEFEILNASCLGTISHIGILSDGSIIPCCLDGEGIITLGNIFKDNLYDIINSNEFQIIKKGFQNKKRIHSLCKKCLFYNR